MYEKLKQYSTTNFATVVNNKCRFMSIDEEKHSIWTPGDFEYYINDYGYRGDWTFSDDSKKIGFYGCSFTLGQAVDEQYTFCKLLESRLNNYQSVNFGQCGASIQRIAKLLSTSLEMFDLDIIVITLPTYLRFIAIEDDSIDKKLQDIVPNSSHGSISHKEKALYKYFTDLDLINYAKDYVKWMVAETKNINKVVFGTYDEPTFHELKDIFKENELLFWQPRGPGTDLGRDNGHPGINTHLNYANQIWDKIA